MNIYVLIKDNQTMVVKASRPTGDWAQYVVCELSPALDGKAFKLLDCEPDSKGYTKKAVFDEVAEAVRLIDETQANEDAKWSKMRSERDARLSATDYIMMPDYPLEDKSAWEAYRMALRDLPDFIEDIDNFTWPTKPE